MEVLADAKKQLRVGASCQKVKKVYLEGAKNSIRDLISIKAALALEERCVQGTKTGSRKGFPFSRKYLEKYLQPQVVVEKLNVARYCHPLTSDPKKKDRSDRSGSKDSGYEPSVSSPNHVFDDSDTNRIAADDSPSSDEEEPYRSFPCIHCRKCFSDIDTSDEHAESCNSNPAFILRCQDPRKDETRKDGFFAGFGLTRATEDSIPKSPNEEDLKDFYFELSGKPYKPPSRINQSGQRRSRKRKVRRTTTPVVLPDKVRLTIFIKDNRIPLTSGLGRKLVLKYDCQKMNERESTVAAYELFCRRTRGLKAMKPAAALKRQKLAPSDDKCHKISFSNRHRLGRNSEIVLGMSSSSFPSLNKCKDVTVEAMLRDAEVQDLLKPKPKVWNFFKMLKPFFQPEVVLERNTEASSLYN